MAVAEALSEEALSMRRRLHVRGGLVRNLLNLTLIACVLGDAEAAARRYPEGLRLAHQFASPSDVAGYLEAAAWCAALRERLRESALLAGAATPVRASGPPLDPNNPTRSMHLQAVEQVRTALGDGEFSRAWAEGRALSLDAAVALALEEATPDTSA